MLLQPDIGRIAAGLEPVVEAGIEHGAAEHNILYVAILLEHVVAGIEYFAAPSEHGTAYLRHVDSGHVASCFEIR
jgi:hypothetical protein